MFVDRNPSDKYSPTLSDEVTVTTCGDVIGVKATEYATYCSIIRLNDKCFYTPSDDTLHVITKSSGVYTSYYVPEGIPDYEWASGLTGRIYLDSSLYFNKNTGLVGSVKHNTKRVDNLALVARSLRRGRDLINANVTDAECMKWCTLTYAENMTDEKRLTRDIDRLVKQLRRWYGSCEYILAVEPQARGAWHVHMLLFFPSRAPFIPLHGAKSFDLLWPHGAYQIRQPNNVDNFGAYLSAYLGNVELNEYESFSGAPPNPKYVVELDTVDPDTLEPVKKKFVKGGRLHFYPAQMHIFRWSRGIKKPLVERMTYAEAIEKTSSAKLVFSSDVSLTDSTSGFRNRTHYEQYNTKRK